MSQDDKFDGILYQMVASSGGYEGFFDQVFGFLRRKTDFFSDFKKAEQVIASIGKKHIEAYTKENKAKGSDEQKTQPPKTSEPKTAPTAPAKPQPEPTAAPKPAEEKKNILEQKDSQPNPPSPEIKVEKPSSEASDKLAPGPGNGSKTEKYTWTQTLEEIQASVFIDSTLRARDLNVRLEPGRVFIGRKDGSAVFLDGEWCDKIHPDDAIWTVEEVGGRKVVELTMPKWKNSNNWWNCLVKGEPPIDTQKINPEPSKLSDLDGEMKSTVEKMMFDMNQKQRGLPSSDELLKQEKLKEFMKAHPEMDFSKAKFG